jgi:type II secretion system protein D
MLDRLFGLPTTTTQGGGGAGGFGGGGLLGQIVQTTTAGNESNVVRLNFAVDVRTNSIIASGTMGDLAVVEAILTKLDSGDVRQRKSVVLRLKNSPATDVAQTLNTYLTTQRTFDQSAPGLTSVYEEFEREVVIVPEPVTNSLVLSATPRFFDEVKGIIEQLDARPLMVTIQVLIASVDLGDTNEFGIELGLQDSTLFDRSVLSNPVVTTTTLPTGTSTQTVIAANNAPGFNFNDTGNPLGNSGLPNTVLGTGLNPTSVAGQGLTNFAVGRQSSLGYGGMVLSAQSQNVSMLIRALAENHKIELLERPQITTLDNQSANVQIGQRVPTINSVSNNALTGQSNTITFQNVGVILALTPRISPDGLVVMQIMAEKSALEPEATGIPIFSSPTGQITRSPIIDTTIAQSTVSAMDGQTIVLGGLISKNKNESHRSVPWLGDLPLIGNLFRYDSTSCERTELLIIMTPHIIRTAADAEALKREEAARMSWCLCDVTKIHGEAGLNPRGGAWGAADVKVVYPDSAEPINLPGEHAPEAVPAPSGQPQAPAALPQPSNQPISPVTPPVPTQPASPAGPVPPMPNTAPAPTTLPAPSAGPVAPSPGDSISGGQPYGPTPAGQAPAYPPVRTPQTIEPAVYQPAQTPQNYGAPQPAVYQQPTGQYQPQFYR